MSDNPYVNAERADIESDRQHLDRLRTSDELVVHEPDDACPAGLWHIGDCDPKEN